jgi:hypothetical protein
METNDTGEPAPGPVDSDAESLAARVEGRLDEVAQRFDRTDWVELLAAIVLALATIVAAWSAYQSARWGGEQAKATSQANAVRSSATQAISVATSQTELDAQLVVAWIDQAVEGDTEGMAAFEALVRDEMRPAFDAWLAMAEPGGLPPGTPLDLPEYDEHARAAVDVALENLARAEEWVATAGEANQNSDNFVLLAVVMASVLFFAGVGSKFRSRRIRVVMVLFAAVIFTIGLGVMLTMPQNVGF